MKTGMCSSISSQLLSLFAVIACFLAVSCSDYFAVGTYQVETGDFKKLYVLKGETVKDSLPGTKVIYKLWRHEDLLVAADIKTESLHIFSFPDFTPVKTIPMPYPVSLYGLDFFTSDIKGTVCGIRGRVNGRIDLLTDDLRLVRTDSSAVYARHYNTMSYDDILPTCIDKRRFWFSAINVQDNTEDRSFYCSRRNSTEALRLYPLNLISYRGYDMKFFPWGTSTLYKRGKRAVYAYEQFKVVKFMETDGSGARTLDFFKYSGNSSDPQWKYIQGYYRGQIAVGRNTLYLANYEYGEGNLSRLYQTLPFEPFTIVETYSFTGEPQYMYRLDREGPVMVDEKEGKIYLLDSEYYSIRSYDIPKK